jgi:hypothetical protein
MYASLSFPEIRAPGALYVRTVPPGADAQKNGSLKPVSNFHCSFHLTDSLALILKRSLFPCPFIIQHFQKGLQED